MRIAPGAPVESFSTPRRLTARMARIAERQDDLEETITGPPVSAAFGKDGQPTPGGARLREEAGGGVRADLARMQTPKGEYLAYHKRQRGRSAVDALPGPDDRPCCAICRSRSRCTGTRSSTTGAASCCSAGRSAGCCSSTAAASSRSRSAARRAAAGPQVQDIESGALTYGHRFLATSGRAGRSIKVRSFEEYQARLAEHFVVLDARRAARSDRPRPRDARATAWAAACS